MKESINYFDFFNNIFLRKKIWIYIDSIIDKIIHIDISQSPEDCIINK